MDITAEERAALLAKLNYALPNDIPDPNIPQPLPCVRQTISLFDLPPELRNRIYSESLPSADRGDQLLIATPTWDSSMICGFQPAITRPSRQTRHETLKMFYANNVFHAYVEYTDFREFFRWVRCAIQTGLVVQVKLNMLHKLTCFDGLLPFAQLWNQLQPRNIHVSTRSAFLEDTGGKTQSQALAVCINTAEASPAGDPSLPQKLDFAKQGLFGPDRFGFCHSVDLDWSDPRLCSVKGIRVHRFAPLPECEHEGGGGVEVFMDGPMDDIYGEQADP